MYHFDSYDNSLVIDGWEKGIADSPFNGIADMRNANIISVPGEASVNFATTAWSNQPTLTNVSISSANTGTDTLTIASTPSLVSKNGTAIVISGSSLPAGITAGIPYWVGGPVTATTMKLYSDPGTNVLIDITTTGTPGDWTFSTINMGRPMHWTLNTSNVPYMVDSNGRVWYENGNIAIGMSYAGNRVPTSRTAGNGVQYYQASDGTGYLFVFHNSSIDYTTTANITTASWKYQWYPWDGTLGGYNATPTARLNTAAGELNTHYSIWAQDNVIYYCDAAYVGSFFEKDAQVFDPTNTATYTWGGATAITPSQALLLPKFEIAQSLAELGVSLLVGGKYNKIYPWNRIDTVANYPIWLPEYFIKDMITVNTNTYIFVGNRGRIYITNGSQVQLFKKIPDHISGTVEPNYYWGGLTTTKNQLYFGMSVVTNAGSSISQYGGVWAIDTETEALRLTNKLSYGTYAGYASAIIAIPPTGTTSPSGTGLYIGWDNGSSGYGVDTTSSSPYTNSETTMDSDLIPIGTFQKPRDFTKIEYRLTKPMVSGESITIKTRLIFNTSDTGYTTTLTDTTVGNYSSISDINFRNAQWVQFQMVLNSTASSPSYTRLKEIRILGLVGPTLASSQNLSL